mmetsp:Transcript_42906/g.71351  ORF Transcript_42906/g.71351 Transcript_42906/m.71351 type:complete len:99 (+) Transcript_42906:248-544(+)
MISLLGSLIGLSRVDCADAKAGAKSVAASAASSFPESLFLFCLCVCACACNVVSMMQLLHEQLKGADTVHAEAHFTRKAVAYEASGTSHMLALAQLKG